MSIGTDLVGIGMAPNQAGYIETVFADIALVAPAPFSSTHDYHSRFSTALAFASGKKLKLRAGSYTLYRNDSVSLSPAANTIIEGDGDSTVLNVVISSGSGVQRRLFDVAVNNVTLRNLKVTFTGNHASDVLEVVRLGADGSGFTMDNVTIDGGVLDAGAAANWTVYPVLLRSTAGAGYTDVLVQNCEWYKFTHGLLKLNSAVSTHRRFRFLNNNFHGAFAETLSFNSPLGIFDDVLVQGNRAAGNVSESVGYANPIHFGFARVTNFRCIGNNTEGTGQPCHIEGGCADFVVQGNTFTTTSTGQDGVFINSNDLSGSDEIPTRGLIQGNTINGPSDSIAVGVRLTFDAESVEPAEQVAIIGNTIDGFDYGVAASDENLTNLIMGNIIRNATYGVWGNDALPYAIGNRIIDCTNGLYSTAAGPWGPLNTFAGTVTNKIASGTGTSTVILNVLGLPTSSAGLATGDVYSDAGTLKVA